MDVQELLNNLTNELTKGLNNEEDRLEKLSVETGCEMFKRYVLIKANDISDPIKSINILKKRANKFAEETIKSKEKICKFGQDFIIDNTTILLHGYSRVVCSLLIYASKTKRFKVIATEGRPDMHGKKIKSVLSKYNIPVELILDCCVSYYMEKIDSVFFGAACVSESGGIINKIGSYQIAIISKALNKPVYVVTESSKFVTLFPLSQFDIPTKELYYEEKVENESIKVFLNIFID